MTNCVSFFCMKNLLHKGIHTHTEFIDYSQPLDDDCAYIIEDDLDEECNCSSKHQGRIVFWWVRLGVWHTWQQKVSKTLTPLNLMIVGNNGLVYASIDEAYNWTEEQ